MSEKETNSNKKSLIFNIICDECGNENSFQTPYEHIKMVFNNNHIDLNCNYCQNKFHINKKLLETKILVLPSKKKEDIEKYLGEKIIETKIKKEKNTEKTKNISKEILNSIYSFLIYISFVPFLYFFFFTIYLLFRFHQFGLIGVTVNSNFIINYYLFNLYRDLLVNFGFFGLILIIIIPFLFLFIPLILEKIQNIFFK